MRTFRLFRTFVAVAQSGSLSAASERVALTPAAVSLQMRALEREMNQSLFDRTGRVVSLNERGHQLLPGIERLLKLYDELSAGETGEQSLTGTLNVGATGSTIGLLAHVVLRMRSLHPGLTINLNLSYAGDLSLRVNEGELDAAVSVKGPHRMPPGVLWTALYDEPFVFIMSHRYEGHETVRKTLMERPFLRPARLTRTGFLIDRLIRKKRYQVNEFMELNSLRTVIDLVRRDVGVSIVPLRRDEIQEADPQLHIVPFHDSQACRHIGLFENQERTHLTSVLRRLVREEVARQHEESDPA